MNLKSSLQNPHARLMPEQAIAFYPFVKGLAAHLIAGETLFEEVDITDAQYLYHRGDTANAFYGVLAGNVKSLVAGTDGKEVVVSYALPGDWFGEIGVWRNKTRLVDTMAVGEVRLLRVTSTTIHTICERHPKLLIEMTDWLDDRIHLAALLLENALFMDLETRLAYWLCHFAQRCGKADESGVEIDLHLTQEELGKLVSVTREAVGRQLNKWKKMGWLEIRYGKIFLLDLPALKEVCIE